MTTRKLRPASESQLAAVLRGAIGVGPNDDVDVCTPQFEREPGAPMPASAPDDADAWDAMLTLDRIALAEIGLRAWNAPDERGKVLMLFPGEWYARIPAGFPIVGIGGTRSKFAPGETCNDIRFGVLAYGIEVDAQEKP